MKFLLSLSLVVLSVVTAMADGIGRHHGPGRGPGLAPGGYLVPGRPAPFPGHRPPPMPHHDYTYGPGYTVRWQPVGDYTIHKFFEREIVIGVGNQYLNELLLTTRDNPVEIMSATGILINGQSVDLPRLRVTVGRDQQLIVKIDGYYSLNLSQLILKAKTPTPFGSSPTLDIQLGLAR